MLTLTICFFKKCQEYDNISLNNPLNYSKKAKNKIRYLIVLFIIFFCVSSLIFINLINKSPEIKYQQNLHLSKEESYRRQWLNNRDFTSELFWYSFKQGDETDVKAFISNGAANFKVLGDNGTFELIEEPIKATNWTDFSNPDLPVLPDNYTVDQEGIIIQHSWDGPGEELENNPSIHFKQNISMPVNMSDYIITSASIQAVVNATVEVDPINGGIERQGDSAQYLIGDYIRFYVLLSDINNLFSYPITEFRTVDLGQDGPPAIEFLNDTYLISVPEDILISYLTSILQINNFNFTITLGIDIYCEDNQVGSDRDIWKEIRFKKVNLTFFYKKKIDRFTSVAWNQDGDKVSSISENQVIVKSAILNFDYKIDQEWPTQSSPNSDIRFSVNDNKHTETIKLSSANANYQEAKAGGFNITYLIADDINFSIQLFIADTFELDRNITISIDNVYFEISYIIIFPESFQEPLIFTGLFIIATIGIIALSGYLIAYQLYLKYPVPIRKVRKYRKSLSKHKSPDVNIISRKRNFNKVYQTELSKTYKFLKGKPKEKKIVHTGEVEQK